MSMRQVHIADQRRKELGEVLRTARETIEPTRFSQKAMAKAIARVLIEMGHKPTASEDSIARWESGRIMPDPHQVVAYCKVLIKKGYPRNRALDILNLAWRPHIREIVDLANQGDFGGRPLRIHTESSSSDSIKSSGDDSTFEFWLAQSRQRAVSGEGRDVQGALFCAKEALKVAKADMGWARATYAIGVAKLLNSELAGALERFDRIINRFFQSLEIERQKIRLTALVQKSKVVFLLGQVGEAMHMCDDIVATYRTGAGPLREEVARALLSKAEILCQSKKEVDAITAYDEAIAVYDDFIENDQMAPEELREEVARGLLSKARMLRSLGHSEEALAAYENVVLRLLAGHESRPLNTLEFAIVERGQTLDELERGEEMIAWYEDMEARLRDINPELLHVDFAFQVLWRKGTAYCDLDQHTKALTVFENILTKMPKDLPSYAIVLESKAHALYELGRFQETVPIYDEAVAKFPYAASFGDRIGHLFINKALALERIGRTEEAIATCHHAISAGQSFPEVVERGEQVIEFMRLPTARVYKKSRRHK